jgi:hypothetical protein
MVTVLTALKDSIAQTEGKPIPLMNALRDIIVMQPLNILIGKHALSANFAQVEQALHLTAQMALIWILDTRLIILTVLHALLATIVLVKEKL